MQLINQPLADGDSTGWLAVLDQRKGLMALAFYLKTKIWQTGALEWWGIIDNEDVYLGRREFPLPPEDGDEWQVRETGDLFRIVDGEIRRMGHRPVEEPLW